MHYYHIIYKGWPSGMLVKQEYQLSSPAFLLLGIEHCTSAFREACYLQVEVSEVLFLGHFGSHRASSVGHFVMHLQRGGEQIE